MSCVGSFMILYHCYQLPVSEAFSTFVLSSVACSLVTCWHCLYHIIKILQGNKALWKKHKQKNPPKSIISRRTWGENPVVHPEWHLGNGTNNTELLTCSSCRFCSSSPSLNFSLPSYRLSPMSLTVLMMGLVIVHDLKLLLPGATWPYLYPPTTRPRPCLSAETFLPGSPLLLRLRGGLLGGHSERSNRGRGRGRDGRRCGTDWGNITWAYRLHAQLSLQAVGEASEARWWLVLITLALTLVAEQLTCPHAQEALGTGVGAHGEWCVWGGQGSEQAGVGAGQGGLHQQGWGKFLTAVDGVCCWLGRVARLWLPWR